MSRYKDAVKRYSEVNLKDIGCYYPVVWEGMPEDVRDRLSEMGIYEDEGSYVSAADIYREGLWEYVDPYGCEYDRYELGMVMRELVKEAPHYLIMAHGCRWNGASGYKITDSIEDALHRSYEVTISPLRVSAGGKCLVCREASHDVPMGSETSIIALSEREYEFLDHWNTAWEAVANFAEKCELKAAN